LLFSSITAQQRYRTTVEAAIVGESLAGLFVIETLLLEPDLFQTYIAADCPLALRMPYEKHSTIFHPAALRAFRLVFKPETATVAKSSVLRM
jgi:hypothetical protein